MNHRTWKMEICYSTPLTELRNEHNALCADWKQSSLEVERLAKVNGDLCDKIAELERPIRVPFSDEVIERMAKAAQPIVYEDTEWRIIHDSAKTALKKGIRAALAAGGLEPCAVPDYAPENVAFSGSGGDAGWVGAVISQVGIALKIAHDEKFSPYSSRGWEYFRAVRSRVEAPLLAEIRHLRGKLASAHQKIERQAAELTKLYHLRQGDAGERRGLEQEIARLEASCAWNKQAADSLRAQLEAVTAERESLVRALVEAKRQRDELASKFIAKNPSEPVYGGWHFEDGYKIVPNGEPSNNAGELPTPTDAQVEALARVLHKAQDGFYCRYGDHATKFDDSAPLWLACARAAYAHIVRVPVGWELDVHPDQLELYKWVTMPDGGYAYAAQQVLDLCRSRIKPVYECKECTKNQTEMKARLDNLAAATYAIRAALEGEWKRRCQNIVEAMRHHGYSAEALARIAEGRDNG